MHHEGGDARWSGARRGRRSASSSRSARARRPGWRPHGPGAATSRPSRRRRSGTCAACRTAKPHSASVDGRVRHALLECRAPTDSRRCGPAWRTSRRARVLACGPGRSPRRARPSGRPRSTPKTTARSLPAASITARTSSMRVSRSGRSGGRSERPRPPLVEADEPADARRGGRGTRPSAGPPSRSRGGRRSRRRARCRSGRSPVSSYAMFTVPLPGVADVAAAAVGAAGVAAAARRPAGGSGSPRPWAVRDDPLLRGRCRRAAWRAALIRLVSADSLTNRSPQTLSSSSSFVTTRSRCSRPGSGGRRTPAARHDRARPRRRSSKRSVSSSNSSNSKITLP